MSYRTRPAMGVYSYSTVAPWGMAGAMGSCIDSMVIPSGSCGRGLNGCGGDCGCGGTCQGTGLGLFDSGFDFTTWGIPEWSVVGLGVYVLFSAFGDTRRGVQRVGRVGKAVRKAV